jgi:hypothetical protein
MSDQSFEDQYLDVLQNIEFAIIRVARQHPDMTDWQTLAAIEALVRVYRAEAAGQEPRPARLTPLGQEVFDAVHAICEWRLGRNDLLDDEGNPVDLSVRHLEVDEIVACLQRIRRSIQRWTKQGGRQGYLTFIDQFLPPGPEQEPS